MPRTSEEIQIKIGNPMIRTYRSNDRGRCAQIYQDRRTDTFTWVDSSRFSLADFERDTAGEKIWVFILGEVITGFASVFLDGSFLHHLYVDENCEGKGVGSSLMDFVEQNVEHPIFLKCLERNERALKFYLARGWVEDSRGETDLGSHLRLRFERPVNSTRGNGD